MLNGVIFCRVILNIWSPSVVLRVEIRVQTLIFLAKTVCVTLDQCVSMTSCIINEQFSNRFSLIALEQGGYAVFDCYIIEFPGL